MNFQFLDTKNALTPKVWQALWLAAVFAAFADLLQWRQCALFLLPGLALPFVPRKKLLWGILGASIVYGLIRMECFAFLANRLFALSEAAQSYEYDYFTVSVTHPGEALVILSLAAGSCAALWGNRANLLFSALLLFAVSYFGIAPGIISLTVLAGLAACNLSTGQSWIKIGLIFGAVLLITLPVMAAAPEPIEGISRFDEQLRDVLSGYSVYYEQTPVPNPVPEPETVPPPPEQAQQPDRGIMDIAINLLLILFSAIALGLLFIPAVIKDRVEKKRKKNRAFLQEPNNAAAIREMYLYAKKWRKLGAGTEAIEPDIEDIWLEAAYSTHVMTDDQKERMHAFVRSTAEGIWQKSDWKQKLRIQYQYGL